VPHRGRFHAPPPAALHRRKEYGSGMVMRAASSQTARITVRQALDGPYKPRLEQTPDAARHL